MTSTPSGSLSSLRISSSVLIFFAKPSAKPEPGWVAPRRVEMPARERSASQGQ